LKGEIDRWLDLTVALLLAWLFYGVLENRLGLSDASLPFFSSFSAKKA
jgi:hypothetical protein